MKLKKWEIALMVAMAVAICCGAVASRQQAALSEKLIRLHVVANSDTQEDQAVKLMVRDDILAAAEPWLAEAADAAEAETILRSHLEDLQAVAEARLAAEDAAAPVTVTLQEEQFPQRDYDTFSLPSGSYLALRVTIGEGEGHNWWCVVFPSLCLAATTEDFYTAAASAGLTDGEVALITADEGTYVLKFKMVEWVQRFMQLFQS